MKKRVIIEVVCGIFIFIIGYFVGDSSAINRVNKQIDTNIENQQSNESKNKEEVKETTNKEQKIFKVGEEGNSGNWSIKVLEAKEGNTVQAGNSSDNKTTSEKYIIIKLQMKNIAKQPVQYSPTEFILGNMKDNTQYTINEAAFDAMQVANSKETIYNKNSGFVGVYNDVNPNTSKQTYVVFEVPKTMNVSDAVLMNANGSGEPTGFYLKNN